MYCQKIICVEAPEMNFAVPLGEETQMAQCTVTLFNDSKILFLLSRKMAMKLLSIYLQIQAMA
jgi:hypothetical protein